MSADRRALPSPLYTALHREYPELLQANSAEAKAQIAEARALVSPAKKPSPTLKLARKVLPVLAPVDGLENHEQNGTIGVSVLSFILMRVLLD